MPDEQEEQRVTDRIAECALAHYDFSASATLRLINVSENSTYRIDDPDGNPRAALRVHRLGYHQTHEIECELDWIEALRGTGHILAPVVHPAADGSRLIRVATDDRAEPRDVVAFDWIDGANPVTDSGASFRRLGAVTAKLHQHSRSWPRPTGFERFSWDCDTMLGPGARWGNWKNGLGLGREEHDVLTRAERAVRARLANYGQGLERFGLVHADLRLANLLEAGDTTTVIDFDDCGFSWFLYDWGTAVSFIEHDPVVPELQAAWVDGYRSVAPLAPEEEAELPTFVMLRRLTLIGWVSSHHEFSVEAAELGEEYTRSACDLAERFLTHVT